jgi:hypothetical protein
MDYGELTGPKWEITFFPGAALKRCQIAAERSGYLDTAERIPLGGSPPRAVPKATESGA